MNRPRIHIAFFAGWAFAAPRLLLLALLGGCLLPEQMSTREVNVARDRDPLNTARLNGFLSLKDDQGPAMRLEVESIEVITDDLAIPSTAIH